MLDIGCGAGRFAEIALDAGAELGAGSGCLSQSLEQMVAPEILAAPTHDLHETGQTFLIGGVMHANAAGCVLGGPGSAIRWQIIGAAYTRGQLFRRVSNFEVATGGLGNIVYFCLAWGRL